MTPSPPTSSAQSAPAPPRGLQLHQPATPPIDRRPGADLLVFTPLPATTDLAVPWVSEEPSPRTPRFWNATPSRLLRLGGPSREPLYAMPSAPPHEALRRLARHRMSPARRGCGTRRRGATQGCVWDRC